LLYFARVGAHAIPYPRINGSAGDEPSPLLLGPHE
jgi:hypothetical protein